jgi:hypothetical protein
MNCIAPVRTMKVLAGGHAVEHVPRPLCDRDDVCERTLTSCHARQDGELVHVPAEPLNLRDQSRCRRSSRGSSASTLVMNILRLVLSGRRQESH